MPVFYEFPEDTRAYEKPALNYMIGSALKASMLSTQTGVNVTDFYFPAGTWCDLYTDECLVSKGEERELQTKAYDFHVHLREGFLVPFQDPFTQNIMSLSELNQKVPVGFKAAPVKVGEGRWQVKGSYFNDDGVSVQTEGNTYQIEIDNFSS